ncbi:ubiquitin carboxyl-terminal hydrolase 21 [Argentina anserina]|uniref:ubiquitin carboxyl-terminal hydrolase 21 n=1 Tax=Argentina anserina TaxID=57926 RepID=UPI00217657AB|nr:ubiquitin carboxyl-terminal hydrolase 21 [Potentilla anserina]
MEALLSLPQHNSSSSPDSMPVLPETLNGSSPFSQPEALDDQDRISPNTQDESTLLPPTLDGSSPNEDMCEVGFLPEIETEDVSSSDPELRCLEEPQEADPTWPPPVHEDGLVSSELKSHSQSSWSPWESGKRSVVCSEPYPVEDSKISMVGAGLYNLGNTCFINAILQCVTHTVPLVEGLRSSNHPLPHDCGSEGLCVVCALREHIDLSLVSSGSALSPLKLVDNLNHFSSYFRRYQQEDAHEFLQCFLDKLEQSWLESEKKETASNEDKNLVNNVFGGSLISKLRCCSCGHYSDTREPLIDLSLEIEDVDSLPRALESFTKIEKINDSETKFTCEKCKEEVSVEKQLVVHEAPPVAAFHLKRFKTDGNYVEKIDKHVEFPLELDLKPYTSGNNSDVNLKYELYAIVEHVGFSATSGHYFCFIRSCPDTWHRLDDSKVTRVREEFVLSQEAYILFYARQGTPWFSSLMEGQMSCSDLPIMNTSPKSVLDNVENIFTVNIPEGCMRNEEVLTTDTRDPVDKFFETNDGSKPDTGDFKETNKNTPIITASSPVGASKCFAETSHNNKIDENICSTSSLVDNEVNMTFDEVRVAGCPPTTPPRSRSADVYSFGTTPEPKYHIPRDYLKSADNVMYKRRSSNVIPPVDENPMRKEAIRYLSKSRSAPRDRRNQLLAAINKSPSEGMNKKRKRVGIMTM